MRPFALFGLILLAGCNYVGNPVAGFGGFISDTVSLHSNPNRPQGTSPNMLRAEGRPTDAAPLLPEAGNVWPGPLPPAKTLADLQKEASMPIDTGPVPGMPKVVGPRPIPNTLVAPARGRVLTTPMGPATTNVGANGVETYTLPNGKQGIVMPNANNTLTLIGSDGSTINVPTPAR